MLLKDKIPMRYIFGKIRYELLAIMIYAVAVAIVVKSTTIVDLSIPITVPTIIGTVISLLLAFRSNQAYDRWWEARTIWGAIVNDSRTLARQVLRFSSGDGYQPEELNHFKPHS